MVWRLTDEMGDKMAQKQRQALSNEDSVHASNGLGRFLANEELETKELAEKRSCPVDNALEGASQSNINPRNAGLDMPVEPIAEHRNKSKDCKFETSSMNQGSSSEGQNSRSANPVDVRDAFSSDDPTRESNSSESSLLPNLHQLSTTNEDRRFSNGSKSSSNMSESSGECHEVIKPAPEHSSGNSAESLFALDGGLDRSNRPPMDESLPKKSKKSKSHIALELVRAKLQRAKLAKLAAEQGCREERERPEEGTVTSERTRHNLRGVQKNREKLHRRMANQLPPPISALYADLVIKRISGSGSEETVRYPRDTGLDLARKYLFHLPEQPADEESQELASRKFQIEQSLETLKQRLAQKQQESKLVEKPLTKEDLELKRREAQAFMDVSYWKHFVSKQEHLLVEVTEQLDENKKALENCKIERSTKQKKIYRENS